MKSTTRLIIIVVFSLLSTTNSFGMKNIFKKKNFKNIANKVFNKTPKRNFSHKAFSDNKNSLINKYKFEKQQSTFNQNKSSLFNTQKSNYSIKNTNSQKDLTVKDKYKDVSIKQKLEDAFKGKSENLVETYSNIKNFYNEQLKKYDLDIPGLPEHIESYVKYLKNRVKQELPDAINEIVNNNKTQFEEYLRIKNLFEDKEVNQLTSQITNTIKTINQKEKLHTQGIFLCDFQGIFDKSLMILDGLENSDKLIAARLIQLDRAARETNIELNEIDNNPYFSSFFRHNLSVYSRNRPNLKKEFEEGLLSFEIPENYLQNLEVLIHRLSNEDNIIRILYTQALSRNYCLFPNEKYTANDFVRFQEIFKKMKNNPEFREEAMNKLGLNQAEAEYKRVNSRKSFLGSLFGNKKNYSTVAPGKKTTVQWLLDKIKSLFR